MLTCTCMCGAGYAGALQGLQASTGQAQAAAAGVLGGHGHSHLGMQASIFASADIAQPAGASRRGSRPRSASNNQDASCCNCNPAVSC